MGSVFRKTVTKQLPQNAEIFTRKGERFARWKDRKGKMRTELVTTGRDGSDRMAVTAGTYTAKYRDGQGLVREVATGCRTKDGAASVLRELTGRAEKVKAQILTVGEAAIADHQQTPLDEHFEVYLTHMRAKDNSDVHIADSNRLAGRLFRECHFGSLRDIGRDVVEQWLVERKSEGMAARTRNSYLQAIRGFCNWCVATDRMVSNPLAKVKKADENADRRRQRRAMAEADLQRLLYVANCRPLAEYGRLTVRKKTAEVKRKRDTWKAAPLTLDDLSAALDRARERLNDNPSFVAKLELRGRERAIVYKILVLTGLRRGELASLTVSQLHLDSPHASFDLKASDEKSREGAELPLRADLAEDLRKWLADKLAVIQHQARKQGEPIPERLPGDTPLFNVPRQLVKTLNRDLAAAGIPKVDDRGRTLDVHALRHSFGTLLSSGGVAPRTAQAAMRHSRIDLTMNVYTDPRLLDVHGALDALPSLSLDTESIQTEAKANGTDDAIAPQFAPAFAPKTGKSSKCWSTLDKTTPNATNDENRKANVVSLEFVKRKEPLSTTDNGSQKRGRRDSNPQPPDRQSGTLTN